ncbi:MAG: hypothetical protein H7228_11945 [Polaromonas sp.]|nr:hypothetical protein [Polaromonas sp.]
METSSLKQEQGAGRSLSGGIHDFNLQCLRILRCTAKAMANSPGGLRFKAGTRPWLEGLATVPVLVANSSQRISAGMPTASD